MFSALLDTKPYDGVEAEGGDRGNKIQSFHFYDSGHVPQKSLFIAF
jgi:hypothetical protein